MQQEAQNPQELISMARDLIGTVLGEATIDTLCMLLVEEVLSIESDDQEALMRGVLDNIMLNTTSILEQRSNGPIIEKGHLYAHFVKDSAEGTFARETVVLAAGLLEFKAQATMNRTSADLKAAFAMLVKDSLAIVETLSPKAAEIEAWAVKSKAAIEARLGALNSLKETIQKIAVKAQYAVDSGEYKPTTRDFCIALLGLRGGAKPELAGIEVSTDNNGDLDIIQKQLKAALEILGELDG